MNDNKKEKKNKSVLQKVLLVLECVVVAVCMVISIIVIVKPGGVTEQGGAKTTFLPVQSDSMEPTIATGSLIFTQKAEPNKVLDLGTIITFAVYHPDVQYLDTHRIVGYRYEDETSVYQIEYFVKGKMENYEDFKAKYPNFEVVAYITRGDKYTVEFGDETLTDFGKTKEGSNVDVSSYDDAPAVGLDKVVAVYKSHIGGVGYVLSWLMEPTNFFIVIMIPLILLLIYNIYEICRYVIGEKVKKQTATAQLSSEEIARKAVEEYIAQQQKLANGANDTNNQSEQALNSTDGQDPTDGEAQQAQTQNGEQPTSGEAQAQMSTDGENSTNIEAQQKNVSDDEKRSE